MTAVCAALYAIVGYLLNLGIVSPVAGVVRFWPSVIVPAVFAVLFGPWVGGIGAAIGIFFADMIYPGHGVALLSLTVGVPSNFLGFFLVGYLGRKKVEWKHIGIGLAMAGIIVVMIAYLLVESVLTMDVSLLFLGVFLGCYVVVVAV
ncbi:MAG: ECF transporter S component, partial [Candidatus Bathyarchaeota archaeon]